MRTTTDTVHTRIDLALTFTPKTLLAGIIFVAIVGATLMFIQEPAVHDAMHNFRHAAGITCH